MKLLPFILLNAVFAVVDGFVTYGLVHFANTDVFIARLFGAFVALAGFAIIQNNKRPSDGVLAIAISSITIIVSYGLFALILGRNPMLQWPVAFAASAFAALLLGAFGYRRALKRRATLV